MTTVICKRYAVCDLDCRHKLAHDHGIRCTSETYQICRGECLPLDWIEVEKVEGQTNILTLGAYPQIKKWHPADDSLKYGYLILQKDLPESVFEAERTYQTAIGLDLPASRPEELSTFLTTITPYVLGANFNDWMEYLRQSTCCAK